ncbi:MAG: PAS domain-containing protein [Spongiibacteraceae bacterium]
MPDDLLKEVRRLNWTLAAISKVNTVLVRAKTEAEIFTGACEAATFQNEFSLAWVGVPRHDEKKSLAIHARAGTAVGYLEGIDISWGDNVMGNGPTGLAIRTGRIQCNNNMLASAQFAPWLERARHWNMQSSFALPIKLPDGKVVAALMVYSNMPNAFGERELELLTQLGDDLGFGIDVLRTRGAYQSALLQTEREKTFSDVMMESLPGIFYFYNEQGRFLRWNKNFMRVSGYSATEISQMHPRDFFSAADQHRLDERIADVFADGESFLEADFLAKDGSAHPYFFTGNRLLIDDVPFLVGVGIDISERKKMERELRDSEERYHSTLDSIQEGCQLIDSDWRYLYLNDASAIHNRRPNTELIGQRMMDVWPNFETTGVFAMLQRCMEQRIALHEETEFEFPNGTKGWFDVRCQPVPEGVFILSIDISERKTAAAALEEYAGLLQAMSRQLLDVQETERRLLARELHDTVGQELTALSLNLSIMRAAVPPKLTDKLCNRLDDSQKLLEETTQHLRNIMVELRPPGIDEFGLLAALREHTQRVASRSGFSLTMDGVEPKPRLAATAAIALFRIVQEALNNTVKHANATEVTVVLLQSPAAVQLIVADNGNGFDTARKPRPGINNMGTTTMRERAEAIGGEFSMISEIGRGTRIVVELPYPPPSILLKT